MMRNAGRLGAAFLLLLGAAHTAAAQSKAVELPQYRQLGASEPMSAPGNNGTDYSANAPSLSGLTLLATIPAATAPRLGYFIEAQCAAGLTVAFDDGAGALTPTLAVLAGPAANGPGRRADDVRHAAFRPHPDLFERFQLSDGGEGLVMISRTTIAPLAAALLALSHAALADVSLPPVSLGGWTPSFAVRYDSAGAPTAGGSNYAAGDTITLNTNGACSTAPVLSVYTISGSAIATFGVQNPGVCASIPAGPLSQASTSGSGSGATFTLKWGPIGYLSFENSVAQTVWLGPGAGSGITTGVSEIGIGYGACSGVTTGNENFCFGTLVGQSIGSGQFNLLIAGGTTISGSSNTCLGVDSCRNATSTGLTTAVGTSALKNQAVSGGNGQTAVGANSMLNQNNANSSNDSSALGVNSCKGVAGTASFRQGTCLGADNGAALTSANTFTFVGRNIGNTTFANGTDVLLLDSGNNNVDTPAGNSSHMVNVAKVIAGDTAGAANPSVCAVGMKCLLGVLRGANFNVTTDQAITIRPLTSSDTGYLASATKYKLQEIWVTNCSASLTTAKGALYTAASKGGTIIGAATTAFTNCTGTTALQLLTALTNMDTATCTAATLFLSLTTAQGAAATGDVYVFGTPIN